MSVGRPSSQLWVNLLQYVGWASPNFVVDLVHAIGFSMAGAYCSSHFCMQKPRHCGGVKKSLSGE